MNNQTPWSCLRVYYYDSNKHRLLLDCIRPIISQLINVDKIDTFYFEPHWEHGPHTRLHVKVKSISQEKEVLDQVKRHVSEYLKVNPSSGDVDAEQYKKRQNSLAWWEVHPNKNYELWSDHTIIESNDGPKPSFLGGDFPIEIVRDFLSEQSQFVFYLLEKSRDAYPKKFKTALQLMYMHAWIFDSTLQYSHLSFRSHAEAFLATSGDQLKNKQVFETQYRKQKELIQTIFKETELNISKDELDSSMLVFFEGYNKTKELVQTSISNGQLKPPTVDSLRELFKDIREENAPNWDSLVETNDFHATLQHDNWQNYMNTDSEFLTIRFMVNLLYTIFLQLGIKPLERYLLCWMFARAYEDMNDFDSVKLVQYLKDKL